MTWSISRESPLSREYVSLSRKMAIAHQPENHTTNPYVAMTVKKIFLASRFDPFSGEFLIIVLHELTGPHSSIFLSFPDTSELRFSSHRHLKSYSSLLSLHS